MRPTNRIESIVWLALLLACAAGGWRFGASFRAPSDATAQSAAQSLSGKPTPSVFPMASRRASWIERVKAAQPGEFPAMVKEWAERFPEDDRYDEYYAPNALAARDWLYGIWLAKDPDGFFKALKDGSSDDLPYTDSAARAMIELMPEKAIALAVGSDSEKFGEFFRGVLLFEISRKSPEVYLQLNPDGDLKIGEYDSRSNEWIDVITNLAKTDAPAAANASLKWKLDNNDSELLRALRAVAAAWKPSDPDMTEWINKIEDPAKRNLALHARLIVLAEKDPKAALAELPKVELRRSNNFDSAQEEILKRLAKEDPKAAVKLMIEAEDYLPGHDDFDPFDASSDPPDPGTNRLLWSFRGIDMRWPILRSIADTLPDDPAECLAGFRRLTAELGREASWQQQFEAEIMRYKCFHWPADYCLEAARQWMNDYRVTENDETLRKLAERAVRNDPQKALSSLGDFPVAIQAELRYEIILRLPASEHERRLELLEQLPLQFWNNSLGESLGRKGEEYAGIVAALPPEKSENLLAGFTRSWAETEPEMVASWLQTLPAPAAYAGSASILADQWFVVDADAASAWLDSLPRDSVRDAAIAKIVDRQAKEDRFDAWRWADTITSPRARVEAYDKIASEWYRNLPPPEEFQDAHRLARQQLGLPAYQIPPKEEPDPFQ